MTAAKKDTPRVCIYCDQIITRVPTLIGAPKFAWKSEAGFYCPRSDGWHEPKPEALQ